MCRYICIYRYYLLCWKGCHLVTPVSARETQGATDCTPHFCILGTLIFFRIIQTMFACNAGLLFPIKSIEGPYHTPIAGMMFLVISI